jgi:hypothetical protein
MKNIIKIPTNLDHKDGNNNVIKILPMPLVDLEEGQELV